MTATPAHRICPFCEACCGLEVRLDDQGRVASVRGHDADVFSAGFMCPKGVALKDLQHDPDRLRTPLVKRNGAFEPATWDEAFDEIERRLVPVRERYGPHAVAVTAGNPSSHKMGLMLYYGRLFKAMGTRNAYSASTLDQMPKQLSSGLMFGHWLSIAVPDIERTDWLLVLGANPVASNGSLWTVPDFRGKARALRARGGRLIVVDPRRTETAELADRHLTIRPGGDVYLLLGMVATLFEEDLVDLGAAAPHVTGLDEVRAAVAPFPAESVAARCGIEAPEIRRLARELAAAPRGIVYGRMGTCAQPFGTLCSWLIDVLNTLTGNLDQPGGVMFPRAPAFQANCEGKPGSGRGIVTGRHHARVSGAPEVFGELPMVCLAEEIETPGDGQVRALITIASNPVLSAPNGPRLARAMDSLEFMVSLDIYLNETSRHADVILPGLAPLEEAHYDVAFHQLAYRNAARFSAPVLHPPAGHVPEWQILLKLIAIAKGRGARADVVALDTELLRADLVKSVGEDKADGLLAAVAPLVGPERQLELALRTGPYGDGFGTKPDGLTLAKLKAAPSGFDFGPLQPRLPGLLRTPSGKVELAPPMLIADLPRALADLRQAAPEFVIVGRRHMRSNNSWMHNLPTLAKGPFRCTALVHPADAARLGLVDGGRARIARDAGSSIDAEVAVTDEVMPGVISLPHGWGHGLPGVKLSVAGERPGVNLNDVLDERLRDPLSGNAVLGGVAVQVAAL